MNNVLFGPTPFPDAFSNTYSYDKAGNIQQLMRRGIVGSLIFFAGLPASVCKNSLVGN